jgi:hypothetical protein
MEGQRSEPVVPNGRTPEMIGSIDRDTGEFVPDDPVGCQEAMRDALDDYLGEA